jgi:peptidoglycan/xylan/chitin deacetylase (PgdA/CDA1 family)
MLTIVMYHYVRDLPNTRYPGIKGLLTERFEGQLDYITRHYTVCSPGQIASAINGKGSLPPNPCLLTFDDGFIDHYLTVFPRLEERGLVGSFYPPARAIEEHRVLDVHKIHFILASMEAPRIIIEWLLGLVRQYRGDYDIPEDEKLYEMYATDSRRDAAEVVFIKKTLQRGLPQPVRSEVVHCLFSRCVSEDEETFAKELYMDINQLRCLHRHGMEIGGHGYAHMWFEALSRSEQECEISRTVDFLGRVQGREPSNWVMCYPFGSYNTVTIELLRKAGCALGLTTTVGLADLSTPLELNRLDTNDLSFSVSSDPSEWTREAQQRSSDKGSPSRLDKRFG